MTVLDLVKAAEEDAANLKKIEIAQTRKRLFDTEAQAKKEADSHLNTVREIADIAAQKAKADADKKCSMHIEKALEADQKLAKSARENKQKAALFIVEMVEKL